MNHKKANDNKLWITAMLAGAGLLALGVSLFRPPRVSEVPAPSHAGLMLGLGAPAGAPADPLFREDAEAHDPTPLFLPTRWNSSEKAAPRREFTGAFDSFGAKLAFSETTLALDLPTVVAVPARAADALDANPPGQPFSGLGRADRPPPALAPRNALVEVVAAGSGQPIFTQALTNLPPTMADSPPEGGAWEFMAAVDAAGLVGTLVQTIRSGTAADGFFLNYLVQNLRVGERLAPGFYRISVGP